MIYCQAGFRGRYFGKIPRPSNRDDCDHDAHQLCNELRVPYISYISYISNMDKSLIKSVCTDEREEVLK